MPHLASSYSPDFHCLLALLFISGDAFVFCIPGTLVQSGSAFYTCRSRSAIGVGGEIARLMHQQLRHLLSMHKALSLNPKNPRKPIEVLLFLCCLTHNSVPYAFPVEESSCVQGERFLKVIKDISSHPKSVSWLSRTF